MNPDSHEPDRVALEAAVAALRAEPAAFADAGELATRVGVDASKLAELCRRHYHLTPFELLSRARVHAAGRRLIATRDQVADIAFAAGWSAPAAFYQDFERHQGLTPGAYRRLHGARDFTFRAPPHFGWPRLCRYWGRDPQSASERYDTAGDALLLALRLPGGNALLRVDHQGGWLRCRFEAGEGEPSLAVDAHGVLTRMFGFETDPGAFERGVAEGKTPALTAGREGLTVPQTANLWDGLVWVVAGQQVSLPVAFGMRRRLTQTFGEKLGAGFFAPPAAAKVAEAEPEDLRGLGFSRAKSDYLLGVARAIAAGDDLEALREATAPAAFERLGRMRGLGPWSINYLGMRGLGLADCVPVGDAALVRSLAEFFGLPARPDPKRTLELMAPFAPYRSLATFHFWSLLEKKP